MSHPLEGRRVVVTRPRAQASALIEGLEALGAEVVVFPTIRIVPAADPEPLRAAAAAADSFDWIVFTSANGVGAFYGAVRELAREPHELRPAICAIGPATAAAVEAEGGRPDVVPEEYVGESLVPAMESRSGVRGARVLLPRAEVARAVVPEELRAAGAEVLDVPAYRTVLDGSGAPLVRAALSAGEIDLLTFTASSTVRNFVELVGTEIGAARVACIGPITAATAREVGLPVDVEATEYTVAGLLEAIASVARSEGG